MKIKFAGSIVLSGHYYWQQIKELAASAGFTPIKAKTCRVKNTTSITLVTDDVEQLKQFCQTQNHVLNLQA